MRLVLGMLVAGILLVGASRTVAAEVTAYVGATLIDGTGREPVTPATMLVEGVRVRTVGPAARVTIPEDARRVDVKGKFIIPGLMDANVHLYFGFDPESLIRYEGRYEDVIVEAAQVALKNGLTTVFDTWGPAVPLRRVRDRIEAGQLTGSRVFFGGNIIGFDGPLSADFMFPGAAQAMSQKTVARINAMWEQGVGRDLLWQTPEEIRAKVRAYIADTQVDFLKYASSGHVEMDLIAFSADAQRAIVEEGHAAGLTVQAHSTSPESLRLEIEAGADLLQHCDITGLQPIPDRTIQLIAQRRIPCAAMADTQKYLTWRSNQPIGATKLAEVIHRVDPIKDANDRKLIAAGAVLLLTTDAGIFAPHAVEIPSLTSFLQAPDVGRKLGEGHFLWLQAVSEKGMTPMAALLAATRNIAHAYGKSAELGTLESGKRADFLVLDADPLADAKNYRRINMVVKDGRIVDIAALPERPIFTAKAP
jgi:imidazolonepropionase-like amidohydrolase